MMGVIAVLVWVACVIPFTDAALGPSCIGHCAVHDYQYCVNNNDYLCKDNEFCAIHTMHHDDIGRHFPHLECVPSTELEHCWNRQANNHPICDPFYAHPPRVCMWCCTDGVCLRNMAQGIFPVKPLSNATQTPQPTTAATTQAATTSQFAIGNSTDCDNFYVGDCGADFENRCDENIVQQICPSYCGVCESPIVG